MADKAYSAVSGSMTKIRAEQIKAEDGSLITLAGELAAIKGQIADIIGEGVTYKEEVPDLVQLKDLAVHLDAETSATTLNVLKALSASNGVTAASFTADGTAQVGHAKVLDLNAAAGALVFADGDGDLDNDAGLVYDAAADKLSVVGIVSGSGALQGASVAVDGAATIGNGMTVNGAVADFNAGITANEIKIDGDVAGNLYLVGASNEIADTSSLTYVSSKLAVTGVISGSGALQGASLAVDGAATAGSVKISGDQQFRLYVVDTDANGNVMKDEANLSFNGSTLFVTGAANISQALDVGGNLTAVTGTFSGNLTVAGDLTVNGTTTTVNSTTLTVDDKNVELGSVATPTDVTAAGGGITLKGATDKTIIWNNSAAGWEFNQAVSGSGNARFAGTVSAPEMKIDGDVAQRLYIVGASNEIKDEASLTFDGSKLSVVGIVSGSGALQGASVAVDGAASVGGTLGVTGAATLSSTLGVTGIATFSAAVTGSAGLKISAGLADFDAGVAANEIKIDGDVTGSLYVVGADGAIKDEAGLNYNFANLLTVSGTIRPSHGSVWDLGSVARRWDEIFAVRADLIGAVTLTGSIDQRVEKKNSGDLIMANEVADLVFDDSRRAGTSLAGYVKGIKLANAGEWATFSGSYAGVDSILGAFNRIAEGGGAEKAFFVATGSVAAETAVNVSAGTGMADLTFSGLTVDNSMVFFNGQLLRSGSVAALAAPASADYSFDGGKAGVKFSFAIESGDQLVVQKL